MVPPGGTREKSPGPGSTFARLKRKCAPAPHKVCGKCFHPAKVPCPKRRGLRGNMVPRQIARGPRCGAALRFRRSAAILVEPTVPRLEGGFPRLRPVAASFVPARGGMHPPSKWSRDSNPSVRLRRPAPFTQGSLIRCAVGANSIVPWKVRRKEGGGEAAPFFWVQHILAPAGILSSSMTRWSFSSPFSVWTAEMSIPQLSWPIIFLGGRLTMASRVLPTSSSGS